MTRDEAVVRVKRMMSFRSDLDTEIVEALQDVQQELEGGIELPWFLRTEVSNITTTVDEERIPTPSNFLREWEDDAIYVFNSAAVEPEDIWKPLIKLGLDQLRLDYPGTGTPEAYAYDNAYFRLGPTPNAQFTLKMIYFKKDQVLTSNIENLWLKHAPKLMIGQAGMRVAIPTKEKDAYAQFDRMATEGAGILFNDTLQRDLVNRSMQMGGPD